MSNTALWDSVCKTDPKEVKAITGKTYSGNSPKPYYIVRRLTETFGPCGSGWGFEIKEQDYKTFGDTTIHVALVKLWYVLDQKRGEIEQLGQTKMAYTSAAGKLIVDEDAPKKSVTDALIKCASYVGFAGDIFSGRWDDSGYVAGLREEFTPKEESTPKPKPSPAKIKILDDLLVKTDTELLAMEAALGFKAADNIDKAIAALEKKLSKMVLNSGENP